MQDVLAWPIAMALLSGAGAVYLLPRVVPARFVAPAVGAVFATVTVALVVGLSYVAERWLRRHAAHIAADAERQVQTVGVAGLPVATGAGALIPLASAYADAGARAALQTAERETADLLARLGADAADAIGRAATAARTALVGEGSTSARDALAALDDVAAALRRVTAQVPLANAPVDMVALVRELVAELPAAAVDVQITTDRGPVLIDRNQMRTHLRDLLTLAQQASPVDGIATLHLSRVFRANIEETPVRRTGDSRLTIVPRSSGDALRAWVLRAQPGAEVLSVIITDAGAAPDVDASHRAFDAFAIGRPGDPLGVVLASVRRTVAAARGTVWIDGSREGGTAVHLLLPIVPA